MNRKEFIFVLIVTFIVILIWIAAEIIHSRPSVPIDPNVQDLLTPLNPGFDEETLKEIESTNFENNISSNPAPQASPTNSPNPQATTSPSPSASPSPSPTPQISTQPTGTSSPSGGIP